MRNGHTNGGTKCHEMLLCYEKTANRMNTDAWGDRHELLSSKVSYSVLTRGENDITMLGLRSSVSDCGSSDHRS